MPWRLTLPANTWACRRNAARPSAVRARAQSPRVCSASALAWRTRRIMKKAVPASGALGSFQFSLAAARVPQIGPANHVDHHLRDVGRMISEALEVLGDEHQARGAADVPRVFHHEDQQFVEELLLDRAQQLVALHPLFRLLDIALHQGV